MLGKLIFKLINNIQGRLILTNKYMTIFAVHGKLTIFSREEEYEDTKIK